MTERKFVDLKALKVSDEGPGVIEGYRSVYGVIDEGGDIVVKGAFADSLSEFLHSGFTAQSHDWDFKEAVGFPVEAYEDDHGWFVKSQFHSTPDAQAIRTKAKERLEAGKQVGFSFGYAPKKFVHIEAKNYEEELPKYIKADQLQAELQKAQQFNRIRILKSVEAIEDSIVTSPMNKRAAATTVKSTSDPEPEPEDRNQEDPNLKEDSVADSFESFDKAVSAIEKNVANMQRNHENRVKEGRVLSSSNRTTAQAWRDSLASLMAELDSLLAATEPKPKEKEIDVEALRTQSLRLRNKALGVLAS